MATLAVITMGDLIYWAAAAVGGLLLVSLGPLLSGMRYIPNNKIGIIEKLWSPAGSVEDGRMIAIRDEAGYQAEILRGGIHFFYWPWQYRIHKLPLTIIPQGKIGYVFARDGRPLTPQQTLGLVVPCNNFQDAREFLTGDRERGIPVGQRGRQRAILREGVYAINLVLFVVITEERIFQLKLDRECEASYFDEWRQQLNEIRGFDPVVVGSARTAGRESFETPSADGGVPAPRAREENDNIAIVTVHDGPSLEPGQIIAPPVATDADDPNYHNNFQDTERFLRAGGSRGRQYVTLTDGTYFINRWCPSGCSFPAATARISSRCRVRDCWER